MSHHCDGEMRDLYHCPSLDILLFSLIFLCEKVKFATKICSISYTSSPLFQEDLLSILTLITLQRPYSK